jgi:hypothetical protein
VVALYYLTLTTLWSLVQGRLERRFGEPSRNLSRKPGLAAGWRRILSGGGTAR